MRCGVVCRVSQRGTKSKVLLRGLTRPTTSRVAPERRIGRSAHPRRLASCGSRAAQVVTRRARQVSRRTRSAPSVAGACRVTTLAGWLKRRRNEKNTYGCRGSRAAGVGARGRDDKDGGGGGGVSATIVSRAGARVRRRGVCVVGAPLHGVAAG
jgi:hypothetical protein